MSKIFVKSIGAIMFFVVLLVGVVLFLPADSAFAQADQIKQGIGDIGGSNARPLKSVIKTIVDLLFFFIGALSVIMIIYGGFRYITSAGESSAVTSAKNTILYAVIGLIVSVLAYSITNFVVGMFDEPTTTPAQTEERQIQQTPPPSPPRTGGPGGELLPEG